MLPIVSLHEHPAWWEDAAHTSFYERCGWEFDGMIEENDGSPIRLYHRAL